MTKHQTLFHLAETITYVESLADVTDSIWRNPMTSGNWSMAETIAHFTPWDQFVLTKRIPHILSGESLPKGPEVEELNANAARESRNRPVDRIINDFVSTRAELIECIRQIEDSLWDLPIAIGEKQLELSTYFKGLDEHDVHHLKQINEYLKQAGIEKTFSWITI